MSKHEWNLPAADDGFPRVLRVAEGEFSGANPEGLLEISGNCGWDDKHLGAEILRLAARVKELEDILADQGRVLFLHGPTETHEAQAVRAMRAHGQREARIAELEEVWADYQERANRLEEKLQERTDLLMAVVAPLLPLFRERIGAWERRSVLFPKMGACAIPATITLTAEFPVEALRTLTKE